MYFRFQEAKLKERQNEPRNLYSQRPFFRQGRRSEDESRSKECANQTK